MRTSRSDGGGGGLEKIGGEVACRDDPTPQFPLFDFIEATQTRNPERRRCVDRRVLQLTAGMLRTEPRGEILYAWRRPNLAAVIAMRPLDGLEEGSRELGIRREDRLTRPQRVQQSARNPLHAQRVCTLLGGATTCRAGGKADCASSKESMRSKTVLMT